MSQRPPLSDLAARLEVDVDPGLLERALTHRSYAYENGGLPTNERLEFLGDSVLGLVVTDALYRTHPDLPEGQLAKLRAAVVNMRALADVGRGLGLGEYLRLGRGEETTGGRDKSSILADTVEALIGAVYLDRGLDGGHRAGAPALRPADRARPPALGAGLDWKTSLQELTAARGLGVPEYVVSESGPDHAEDLPRAGVRVGGEAVRRRARAAARRRPSSRRPRRRTPAILGTPRRPVGRLVPELPEVEVVRRGLDAGSPAARSPTSRCPHPRAVRRHVAGARRLRRPPRRSHGRGGAAAAASTSGCRSTPATRPSSPTSA